MPTTGLKSKLSLINASIDASSIVPATIARKYGFHYDHESHRKDVIRTYLLNKGHSHFLDTKVKVINKLLKKSAR